MPFSFRQLISPLTLLPLISLPLASITLLSSCVTPHVDRVLDNKSRNYIAPKSYTEHRAQQHKFQTPNGTYAYTDHGDKTSKNTIVMIHGVPTNSWMYRNILPSLQQSNRIITIDLLGFGSSSKPETKGSEYTPESQAKNVQALLNSINVKDYTLMMHDMGGLVAWEILSQKRSSLKNLIVLNTIVTKEGFDHPTMKPGNLTEIVTKAYSSSLSSSSILKKTFDHMGLTGADKLKSNECSGYVTPLKEGSDSALYQFFTSLNSDLYKKLDSYQDDLNGFKGRTLVLWGAKDKNLTPKQIPYLQKHLRVPAQNIHIYPDSGHLLTEEIPQEVVNQINAFLK